MKTVDFAELYKMDYSILKITALYHMRYNEIAYSTPTGGRPKTGLMYFRDCEKEYYVNNQLLATAVRGDISMVPQGFDYSCRYNDCGVDDISRNEYLIGFELYDADNLPFTLDGTIRTFKPQNSFSYSDRFHEILVLYNKDEVLMPEIKALLYRLLTEISLEIHKFHRIRKNFAQIETGINYLEQHYSSDIKSSELADMCHVCESYFRRLFKQYAGVSPIDYMINLRLNKAKIMLEDSILSVSEIADSLGFNNTSYFSRLYKGRMGISPRSQRNSC